MANRCTALDVKSIMTTKIEVLDIEVFIGVANLTVTDLLGDTTELSGSQLKNIEMFLSAHFISARDPRAKQENIGGDYSRTIQGEFKMGLDSTAYGQIVKLLDTTGILGASLGKKKASMEAVTSFA